MMSFVLKPSTLFPQVSWSMLWPHHQIVTDVTVWPITSNPNSSCSKIENKKIKRKEKLNWKIKFTFNDLDNMVCIVATTRHKV